MSNLKFLLLSILIFNISFLDASSRVSFSRPGNMMRIPSGNISSVSKILNINISYEWLSKSQGNSNFSINSISNSGSIFGVSFVSPADPINSSEIGLHFQKNMLIYGNVEIEMGIHDIVWKLGDYSTTGLDTREVSFFAVLSNEKNIKKYSIITHLGLGTGKIAGYSQLEESDSKQNIGAFLGFEFKTPLLIKGGGISLLTEFDGNGVNIGVNIPLLSLYQLNLGITHFDNLGNLATEDKNPPDYSKLSASAPAINFGLSINIPRIYKDYLKNNRSAHRIDRSIYSKTDSSILYYNPICTEVVEKLRDSIRVGNSLIENFESHNIMLLHQSAILVDSTRNNLLREEVGRTKQNESMRHLSRSLRFFYNEDYRKALSEINNAIEANPNLAIAYGRRGSIYYKLGDVRRATLNWNVALQLDPEFIEIYNMLKAYDQDLLKSIEISNNKDEN